MNSIFRLEGVIQQYAWGGHQYIPNLLGFEPQKGQPYAELWMGAHPRGASKLLTPNSSVSLPDAIERNPEILGNQVRKKFGNHLPYLFKVLEVKQMLSIQAHPNKKQAEEGFKRENETGIPLNAPHRNYKDDNHKPEVMIALSDFWLLHGFRKKEEVSQLIKSTPEFKELAPLFVDQDLYLLYKSIMTMPSSEVNRILAPLKERLQKEMEAGELTREQYGFWAHKAFKDFTLDGGQFDRGIFSIYLFNLVHIPPGQGIYQGAGIPHAYLEGITMELMANSDNVFRGGLTVKHVDVPELLKNLHFKSVEPKILAGQVLSATETTFPTPAPDFELSRISLQQGQEYQQKSIPSPHTLIVMEGEVSIIGFQTFKTGQICFVTAGSSYLLRSTAQTVIYKASVP